MPADLNFTKQPIVRCIHCNRVRGDHRAQTYQCPIGRGNFPQFRTDTVFTPKAKK